MKIGVVLNSNDPETAWNALRFGLTALLEGHEVTTFLMGPGVEVEDIRHEKFNAAEVLRDYLEQGGKVKVCGACLDVRGKETGLCSPNIMNDLVKMVVECDRVVSFG
jgi:uncharacterized protein involved in oxidation of intracellular sulfur